MSSQLLVSAEMSQFMPSSLLPKLPPSGQWWNSEMWGMIEATWKTRCILFHKTAITKCHKLRDLNRVLFSQSFGGYKSQIKVPAGLVLSKGCDWESAPCPVGWAAHSRVFLGLWCYSHLCLSPPCVSLFVQSSPFYKDS